MGNWAVTTVLVLVADAAEAVRVAVVVAGMVVVGWVEREEVADVAVSRYAPEQLARPLRAFERAIRALPFLG